MIEILTDNHYDKMLDLFEGARKNIKIISPFISKSIAEKLCESVRSRSIKCTFITRFYMEDMLNKANSIEAIELMMNSGIEVLAVKGLHTKLYLFDEAGIIGSANFTAGGFKSNIELSLFFQDEVEILSDLHMYYDEMYNKIIQAGNGVVTKEIISDAKERYFKAFDSKKNKGKNLNSYMFGVSLDKKTQFSDIDEIVKEIELCSTEADIVNDMFKISEKSEQIKCDHTIWLKFDGTGYERLNAHEGFPMIESVINGKKKYVSNYPFKVGSIKEKDEIYFAALTTDTKGKNQPVIVGRGWLRAFEEKNKADEIMLNKYSWMDEYPWYCVIDSCEIIDSEVCNGIPMNVIWDELGSDTYISSFGKNEKIAHVAIKHHQKAHIRLTGNAKEFIDNKLEHLFKKYGSLKYESN